MVQQLTDVRHLITNGFTGRYALDPNAVIGVAIHHSVSGGQFYTAATMTAEDEIAHLLMIDQYHVSRGSGGFGYHTAACPGNTLAAWLNLLDLQPQEEDDMDEPTVRRIFADMHTAAHAVTGPTPRTHTVGPEGARGLWGIWTTLGAPASWSSWLAAIMAANGWADTPVLHEGEVIRLP